MMNPYFAGIDIGSTMTKAVILQEEITAFVIGPTGPEQRRLAKRVMEEVLKKSGLSFDSIAYVIATGYGRLNVPFADKQVSEISCHARGVAALLPQARTIIDVGGQDCKAVRIDPSGRPIDFVMNDKCAAGSGRFIEAIADTLGLRLEEMGDISLRSRSPVRISNICTIWAQQEVASRLAEGAPLPDLVAGVHKSLAERVVRMVNRIKVEKQVVLTGGGAKNGGLVRAISDELGSILLLPPEPLITGALGAALLAKDFFERGRQGTDLPVTRPRILEEIEIL